MSSSPAKMTTTSLPLRAPDAVMRLERMGSYHPMRLSFSRQLLRRMATENWSVEIGEWAIDDRGFGHAVIKAVTPDHTYSLVAFSHDLDDADRSDRVIAERWDATFSLVDGVPGAAAIAAMADTVSKQEAGRQASDQLTLSRANKSVRMFSHVIDSLAAGKQPDGKMVNDIGYVMRTTAVYGNGKFGIGDRDKIAHRPAMLGAFQVEMLTVYLIRHFSLALISHLARVKGGGKAVELDRRYARHFGIGNATGLGMAPFLVHHQALLHGWMETRELALATVLGQASISAEAGEMITALVDRAIAYTAQWRVDDQVQSARITTLEEDLSQLQSWVQGNWWRGDHALKTLMDKAAAHLSLEAQEMLVSIVLEPFGALIDDLAAGMSMREKSSIRPDATVGQAIALVERDYRWALELDLDDRAQSELFWYVSEAKLEPRLGRRFEEEGADQEMPFDIPHQIQAMMPRLKAAKATMPLAGFMLAHPECRYVLKRIMTTDAYPYSEIRDNLVAATTRPIDMLRCKLSFFGASKFDPKSDLWTRITLYQGAPLADELTRDTADGWLFAPLAE
ncbi:MAG: hypothetical protein J4F41_02745 [Alphaproteobacteria bacterium]|nr:hypothetical protein [Alphaproteobacteria bacterium]